MTRPLAAIFLVLFTSKFAAGQDPERKFSHVSGDFLTDAYVGLSLGAGFPTSTFNDTKLVSTTSGYAKTGLTYAVNVRYAFATYIGVTLKYFHTQNPFDEKAYSAELNNIVGTRNGNIYQATSDPWELQGFMAGPTYIIKGLKYNFEPGISGGVVLATFPQNSVKQTTPPDSINIYFQNTESTKAWALSVDLAFRYRIYEDVIISLQGDFTFCDPTFKDVYTYVSNSAGNFYFYPPDSFLIPFRLVHLSLGVGYQF